jgi:hypothetical protein
MRAVLLLVFLVAPCVVFPDFIGRNCTAIQTLEHEHAKLPPKEFALKEINILKATMQERIAVFRELLRGEVTIARQALRKLLDGPVKFPAVAALTSHNRSWRVVLQSRHFERCEYSVLIILGAV